MPRAASPATPVPALRRLGATLATFAVTATLALTFAAPAAVASEPTEPTIDPSRPTATGPQVPCDGDGTSGYRVQAVYAYQEKLPAYTTDPETGKTVPGGGDRFADVEADIQQWAADVSLVYRLSAAQTGGYRDIRWVTEPDGHGGCVAKVAKFALSAVAREEDGLGQMTWDMVGAHSETDQTTPLDADNRKYLTWADSPYDATELCGVGEDFGESGDGQDSPGQDNLNNGGRPMYARVNRHCWSDDTAAHELTHTLGAVMSASPNHGTIGHCTDENDLMCYKDGPALLRYLCPKSQQFLLDCNGDDYFSTNPAPGSWLDTHWNIANSRFLIGGGDGVTGGARGDSRSQASADPGTAGLPTPVRTTLSAPSGRTHTTAWSTVTAGCAVTAAGADQGTLRCAPGVAVGAVTATTTDNTGTSTYSSIEVPLAQTSRAGTVAVTGTSPGCGTGPTQLTAKVTDTSTGTGVYGATVEFLQGGTVVATGATDSSGVATATGAVTGGTKVTARVTDAAYAGATLTGTRTLAASCPVTSITNAAVTSLEAASTGSTFPYDSGVQVSGFAEGARGRQPGATVAVTIGDRTETTTTTSSGVWRIDVDHLTDAGPMTVSSGAVTAQAVATVRLTPWTATWQWSVNLNGSLVLCLQRHNETFDQTKGLPNTTVTITHTDGTATTATTNDYGYALVDTSDLSGSTVLKASLPIVNGQAYVDGREFPLLPATGGESYTYTTAASDLTLTTPSSVSTGTAATATGKLTLTTAAGDVATAGGKAVDVAVTTGGVTSHRSATTTSTGSYSLSLGKLTKDVTVTARVAKPGDFPAATSPTRTITVTQPTYTTAVGIASAPTSTGYGTRPYLRGTLAVASSTGAHPSAGGKTVRVVLTPSSRTPVTLTATVSSTGTWSVRTPPLTRATSVVAHFDGAGAWPAATSPIRTVKVGSFTAKPVVTSSTRTRTGPGYAKVTGKVYKTYGGQKLTYPYAKVAVRAYDSRGRWRATRTTTANKYGSFSVSVPVRYTGTLRTSVAAVTGIRSGSAPNRAVTVRNRATIRLSTRHTSYRHSLTARTALNPGRYGRPVYLQRYAHHRWSTVAKRKTNRKGAASASVRQTVRGTVSYRWYAPGDRYNASGYSPKLSVRVR